MIYARRCFQILLDFVTPVATARLDPSGHSSRKERSELKDGTLQSLEWQQLFAANVKVLYLLQALIPGAWKMHPSMASPWIFSERPKFRR